MAPKTGFEPVTR